MTTDFLYRVALILPISNVPAGNSVAEAFGWGSNVYSIPLTSDGVSVTHKGLSTVATQNFIDLLSSAQAGTTPDGIDPLELQEVLDNLEYSVGPSSNTNPRRQFFDLLDTLGLTRYSE